MGVEGQDDPHYFEFDLDRGISAQAIEKLESSPLLPLVKHDRLRCKVPETNSPKLIELVESVVPEKLPKANVGSSARYDTQSRSNAVCARDELLSTWSKPSDQRAP